MSKDETGYNGWTNYETWVVNLHLTNCEFLYAKVTEIINHDLEIAPDGLREFVVETVDNFANGLMADLLRHSLQNVNWNEIVESWEA